MKTLLKAILSMEDVKGVMLFSYEGELVFQKFLSQTVPETKAEGGWASFISSLNGVKEAHMVFDRGRLYLRKTEHGYLLVVMGLFSPVSLLKLHCDIVLSSANGTGKTTELANLHSPLP